MGYNKIILKDLDHALLFKWTTSSIVHSSRLEGWLEVLYGSNFGQPVSHRMGGLEHLR